MFLHKAMRYYRLWIYSANAVILLGAIIFSLSLLYVGSDYRVRLIVRSASSQPLHQRHHHRAPIHGQPARARQDSSNAAQGPPEPALATPKSSSSDATPAPEGSRQQSAGAGAGAANYNYLDEPGNDADDNNNNNNKDDDDYYKDEYSYFSQDISVGPTEPNLLLAYVAVAIQAGLLQALGCFGAMRMKERLVQAFWLLILALTVFDIVFFLYWINRFEMINEGLQRHLAWRLREQYGWWPEVAGAATVLANGSALETGAGVPESEQNHGAGLFGDSTVMAEQSDKKRLDKTFTEIVDKIQAESQCCGILRPSDYRHSAWRRLRAGQLVQLAHERHLIRFRNSTSPTQPVADNSLELLRNLVQELKWVPASCCRRTPLNQTSIGSRNHLLDRFLDDSQVRSPNRVPAWSPSQALPGSREPQHPIEPTTFGPPPELLQDKFMGNPSRRRLLAKQGIYGKPAAAETNHLQHEQHPLQRRWAVESRVNEQGEVVMRLVAAAEGRPGYPPADPETERWSGTLAYLRHLLLRNESLASSTDNFVWPNSFALSLHQFRLVEGYLSGRTRRHLRPDARLAEGPPDGSQEERQHAAPPLLSHPKSLEMELLAIIRSELTCMPREYTDSAVIYTDGCQPHIRAWLQASGHLLFVAGFCVLTVLKLCSLVLLRLEIREMIHKIRVLKGMATEYNALADLEAYLPAAGGVCAPELAAASPISPLLPAAAGGAFQAPPPPCSPVLCPPPQPLLPGSSAAAAAAAGPVAASGSPSPTRRLGGSFSEAVVAAASKQLAAAAQHHQKSLQQHGHPLLSTNRANSMKAVMGQGAAAAAMLDPSNALSCARSTSAHLHHLSALAGSGPGTKSAAAAGYLNAQSSLSAADHLFSSGMIPLSRRHTAVSVCPSAAAAVAAAAAHHLMSRRGTCYTNQAFPSPGGCGAASSLQLSHHRSPQLQPEPATTATANHQPPLIQALAASLSPQPQLDGHTAGSGGGAQQRTAPRLRDLPKPSSSSGDQSQASQRQLLSLLYPFKRQSSGGAQSACNFSLDSTGAGPQQESRRSIH